MTRMPSGSSTTPTPYGVSPWYPGGAAVTAVHAHRVPRVESSTGSGCSVAQYVHASARGKWTDPQAPQRVPSSAGGSSSVNSPSLTITRMSISAPKLDQLQRVELPVRPECRQLPLAVAAVGVHATHDGLVGAAGERGPDDAVV